MEQKILEKIKNTFKTNNDEFKILGKLQKKEPLARIARMATVLAIAAILLVFISSLNLEMNFARRQVGLQTNFILQGIGMNTTAYQHSVTVPRDSPIHQNATDRLIDLGLEERELTRSTQFLAQSLPPEDEKILNTYTQKLREQGYRVYRSPMIIDIQERQEPSELAFQVDIVQQCVGWIGMFAITALIIAYPDAKKKDRFLGIVLTLPLIHIMNLVRLTTTIYAGWTRGIHAFEFVHDALWRTLLILWALVLWVIWIKYVVKK